MLSHYCKIKTLIIKIYKNIFLQFRNIKNNKMCCCSYFESRNPSPIVSVNQCENKGKLIEI